MPAARKFRIRSVVFCVTALAALLNVAPAFAVLHTQDAPSTAIEKISRTLDDAVIEVSSAIAGQASDSDSSVGQQPDWERFSADGAEIWLPASFEGGDLAQDLDLIIERVRALGPDFAGMTDAIEQNAGAFALWAIDTEQTESGMLTNVTIGSERVLSAMSTEMYLGIVRGQLPDQYEFGEQEEIDLPQFEDASRMMMYLTMPGSPLVAQVMYALKDDNNTLWFITFTTGASQLDARLPVFDRSAESFAITAD